MFSNADLLQLGGSPSYSNGNPFAKDANNTDPFAEHVFDPFASKNSFLESGKEINQNTIKVSLTLSNYIPSDGQFSPKFGFLG